MNGEDKKQEVFYQETPDGQNKEEKGRVLVVDPTDFVPVVRFVTLQDPGDGDPVQQEGGADDEERDAPGVVGVDLDSPLAGAGREVGDKRSADVKTDDVHAEERDEEEVVRASGYEQTDRL